MVNIFSFFLNINILRISPFFFLDQQQSYDKEFFAHYGQIRSSNNDISYQQQSSTPTQSTKDTHITSKLSPTAATFSHGAPLTASPSATALYLNPVTFPMQNYYPSMGGTTHQDRTLSYSSVDNRVSISKEFAFFDKYMFIRVFD
jgi:hypothetical protein